MKLNSRNRFLNALVFDPGDINYFSYEGDLGVPRVIVSGEAEIKVQTFGDHVGLVPFDFKTEEDFNRLAADALMKSVELNGKVFSNFDDAKTHFHYLEIPGPAYALVNKHCHVEIQKHSFEMFYDLQRCIYDDRIGCNEVYLMTEAEFLGVISAKPVGDDEHYAIGIVNTNGVVKVVMEE